MVPRSEDGWGSEEQCGEGPIAGSGYTDRQDNGKEGGHGGCGNEGSGCGSSHWRRMYGDDDGGG